MAATLIIAFTFLQVFRGFVDALEGNCRLFGYNEVVKFDLHEKICCDGTVYVRDLDENGNEKTKCCYGKTSLMYDVETHECCEGKVISKDSSGCCQGKVYIKERDTCCEGQIKSRMVTPCCGNLAVNPHYGVQCCGGAMYDNGKQTCCNGSPRDGIGECCGDILVENPLNDICCHHNGATCLLMEAYGTKCCGLNKYRPAEQLCCKSIVRDKTNDTTECCGNTTFDLTREVCCQEHVLIRDTEKKNCCGGRLYNEEDEVCCKDKIYTRQGRSKCCDDKAYQEEKSLCFNNLNLRESIPRIAGIVQFEGKSSTAYLKTNQFECGGMLMTRTKEKNACCNATPYNNADHLCCNVPGSSYELVKKSPSHDRCCGRASYDTTSHGCCKSTKLYDLENEICNKDGVHPRYGKITIASPDLRKDMYKDKLCKVGEADDVPYNSNTSVCTPIGVVALPVGLDVCGNKTFNKDLFICCRGNIFAKHVDGEVQQCCSNPEGLETFTPAFETCFNGRIENIPEKYAGICRGKVYDNRTRGCDVVGEVRSNEEIKRKPNVCWHNETHYSYFNETSERCCNGHVINGDYTCCAEESECCNPGDIQGYNRETHVCCGGVLKLRRMQPSRPNNLLRSARPLVASLQSTGRGNNRLDSQDNSFLCCQETQLCENGTDCCGDKSYDNETELCCGGRLLNKSGSKICCGNHAFHPSNEDSLCCDSSLYENATGHACCGGVKYNLKNETCCTTGGKTYVFSSRDGLCCSNGEDYDDTLHTCCDGLVHKYITSGTCCGNDVIRDPTIEGCFKDRVYQHG